jgi:hypothetical protein
LLADNRPQHIRITMSTRMEEIRLDGGIVASAIISAALAFFAWIIRVAARETLAGLKQSIDRHADAIDTLAIEVKEMRTEVSDLKTRMVRVETWHDK